MDQFKNFCQKDKKNCAGNPDFDECFEMPSDPEKAKNVFKTFPPIKFYFEDLEYNWYPKDYFAPDLDKSTLMCLGIGMLRNVILGGTFMRNYDITIDKVNKKISFTRSNCSQSDSFYSDYPNDYPKNPAEITTAKDIEKVAVKVPTKDTEKNVQQEIDNSEEKRRVMIEFVVTLTTVTLFFVFITVLNYYKEKKN